MTSNSNCVYEQTKAAADSAYEEIGRTRQAFNDNMNDAYDATKNSACEYYHDIEHIGQTMNESARHAVEVVRESCSGVAQSASDQATAAYKGTWETIDHAGALLSDTATAVVGGAKETMHGLADSQPGKAAREAVHCAGEAIANATMKSDT